MKSRTGLFISFMALMVLCVSGVGFVVFQQSQDKKSDVKLQTQRYEAEKLANKKQKPQTTAPETTFTEQKTVEPTPEPVQTSTVMVYFSKNPDSSSVSMVFPVERAVFEGQDANTIAIQELFAGPTADEKANGFFGGIELQGDSSCDGKDFILTTTEESATLKLCRKYKSDGLTDDARTRAQLNATVKQLTGVTKVVLQDSTGNCLFQIRGKCVQ